MVLQEKDISRKSKDEMVKSFTSFAPSYSTRTAQYQGHSRTFAIYWMFSAFSDLHQYFTLIESPEESSSFALGTLYIWHTNRSPPLPFRQIAYLHPSLERNTIGRNTRKNKPVPRKKFIKEVLSICCNQQIATSHRFKPVSQTPEPLPHTDQCKIYNLRIWKGPSLLPESFNLICS